MQFYTDERLGAKQTKRSRDTKKGVQGMHGKDFTCISIHVIKDFSGMHRKTEFLHILDIDCEALEEK
jgi:hypothetical protein